MVAEHIMKLKTLRLIGQLPNQIGSSIESGPLRAHRAPAKIENVPIQDKHISPV